MKKEALRVSTTIPAAPTTIYLAWLASEQHSEMTGATAKIDASVGGKFTACNGYITGKLVTLDLGRRIVMSWRTTDFPRELPDSRVEVHFEPLGGSTRLTVLHMDIPEGQGEQYRTLWNEKYFTPMRNFFSKFLPDPRKPPPPRPSPPDDEEEEESQEEEAPPKKGKLIKPTPPSKKVLPAPKSKAALAKPSKPVAAKPAKAKPVKAKPAKPAKPAKAKPAKAKPAEPAKAAAKPKLAAKKAAAKPKKPAANKPAPAKKKR
jgi:uncharacterized protein YndB with AHSA1/START domain